MKFNKGLKERQEWLDSIPCSDVVEGNYSFAFGSEHKAKGSNLFNPETGLFEEEFALGSKAE